MVDCEREIRYMADSGFETGQKQRMLNRKAGICEVVSEQA